MGRGRKGGEEREMWWWKRGWGWLGKGVWERRRMGVAKRGDLSFSFVGALALHLVLRSF
ncbi:MAG: hypothetical protein ACKESB_01265 [Candidatus Hodgkinia cicadicola]